MDTIYKIPSGLGYKCIVCKKVLDEDTQTGAPPTTTYSPCNKAVHFETTGNYGSSALDGAGMVFAAICDSCFIERSDCMLIHVFTRYMEGPLSTDEVTSLKDYFSKVCQ